MQDLLLMLRPVLITQAAVKSAMIVQHACCHLSAAPGWIEQQQHDNDPPKGSTSPAEPSTGAETQPATWAAA